MKWIKKFMYNTQITNAHIMIYLKMIWHDLYTNYMNTKSYIDTK